MVWQKWYNVSMMPFKVYAFLKNHIHTMWFSNFNVLSIFKFCSLRQWLEADVGCNLIHAYFWVDTVYLHCQHIRNSTYLINSGMNLGWNTKGRYERKILYSTRIDLETKKLWENCADKTIGQTYMVWEVCIHNNNEAPCSMLHSMNVSSPWYKQYTKVISIIHIQNHEHKLI